MIKNTFVIILAACAVRAEAAPRIEIGEPTTAGAAPLAIRLTGLKPGQKVALTAERQGLCGNPAVLRSRTVFTADRKGLVDLAKRTPDDGGYQKADPFGPFWSMTYDKTAKAGAVQENEFRLALDAELDGSIDDEHRLSRSIGLDQARRIDASERFPGALLVVPRGVERAPVIITLAGSEGGHSCRETTLSRFIDSGFAVLNLPYYSPRRGGVAEIPGLPATFADLPVERLEEARDWLRSRDDVDGTRIGLFGVSKGAELALLAASLIEGFGAVAAIVPSDVVWEGWGRDVKSGQRPSFSFKGEPLAFVPYVGMEEENAKFARGEIGRVRTPHDKGRAAYPDRVAAARIKVEDIASPVLVAGGDRDNVWNSGEMARSIAAQRAAHKLPTIALVYPEGTHSLAGDGFDPAGSADHIAQREVVAKTLELFETALKPPRLASRTGR